MEALLTLLNTLGIPFTRFDHPAVFTCEESDKLCQPMPGAHTKQLLLRSKKRDKHVLAIVMHDKRVDTRALAKEYGVQSFSFASPELLMELLGVEPGSVTPFGLMFDKNRTVEVIVDEDAWNVGTFRFHPLVNTATLTVDQAGFQAFLAHTGHAFHVRTIPQRSLEDAA
jgi:Ala-tRNA(Pro) deacylase